MDVPFFLVGGRARGEMYGEKVTPLSDAPCEWIVVARPGAGSGTHQAYRRLDELDYPWHNFCDEDVLYNDFERVASQESIRLIKNLLDLGARDAALSGSGSATFGRFTSREAALKARGALLNIGTPRVWIARTLTRAESLLIP